MKFHTLLIAVSAAALSVAPISSASAQGRYWHYRHHCCNSPFGLVGAVVVGAATIATLPLVALDDVFSGPGYDRQRGYYRGPYDGPPPPPPYAQDRDGYDGGQAYQDPRGYDGRGYEGGYPPQAYPPPPGQNYAPQQDDGRGNGYGPTPGYGGPPPGY